MADYLFTDCKRMSVLISQDGKVLVNDLRKNHALLPVRTGNFTISLAQIKVHK